LRSSSGRNFLKSEQIYDSIKYHGAYEEQKKEGEIIEKRITHVTASFFLSQDGEVHFDANQSDCFRFASGDSHPYRLETLHLRYHAGSPKAISGM
jgi:hypothetical protein